MSRPALRLADVAVNDIQEQADWYEQRSDHALARRWENGVTAALILHRNESPLRRKMRLQR
jgi:hypothetical protein